MIDRRFSCSRLLCVHHLVSLEETPNLESDLIVDSVMPFTGM